ncbi:DUF1826 domain-containing protein [Paracoccaceae bacterium Fryx2]|nr:DUF1826 domain-containing protein [Paracoccaceae bacterium Fryx2]
MTNALREPRPRAVWVASSEEPGGLSRIHGAGIAAATWRRRRDPGFAAWIEGLAPSHLPRLRALLAVTKVEAAVHAA